MSCVIITITWQSDMGHIKELPLHEVIGVWSVNFVYLPVYLKHSTINRLGRQHRLAEQD